MTALFKSLSLTIIHDVFSLSIPTYLHFSQVRKPILDSVLCHHSPRRISLTFRQHPLYLVGDPYICATTLYGPCYYSHPQHPLHLHFASGWHLLMPEPSHPSHVIGSFVTGTAITSACQEARSNSVVPPLLRQAMEGGGNWDNGDSKWRQSATPRQ